MSKIDKETYPAASKMNMLAMILNIAMTVIISIISGLSIFKKKPILGRIQPIQTTISLKAPYNDPQGANIQLQQLRQGPETSQKPALPGTPRPFREKQGAMTLPTRSQ